MNALYLCVSVRVLAHIEMGVEACDAPAMPVRLGNEECFVTVRARECHNACPPLSDVKPQFRSESSAAQRGNAAPTTLNC